MPAGVAKTPENMAFSQLLAQADAETCGGMWGKTGGKSRISVRNRYKLSRVSAQRKATAEAV